MTDQEFLSYVRSILNEPTAVYWQDEEIELYKKIAINTVRAQFWNLLYPIYKKPYLITVPITGTVPLPDDCQKVIRIEYTETGDKCPFIGEDRHFHWINQSPGAPNGWTYSGGELMFFPLTRNQEYTDYLTLWYLPRAESLTDLPEELHPLIAVETVIAGRHKDENVHPALEQLRVKYYLAALKALQEYEPVVTGELNRDEDWE